MVVVASVWRVLVAIGASALALPSRAAALGLRLRREPRDLPPTSPSIAQNGVLVQPHMSFRYVLAVIRLIRGAISQRCAMQLKDLEGRVVRTLQAEHAGQTEHGGRCIRCLPCKCHTQSSLELGVAQRTGGDV